MMMVLKWAPWWLREVVKNLLASAGDGLDPGPGRSLEGNGNRLLYSCLQIPLTGSLVDYSPVGSHKKSRLTGCAIDAPAWCLNQDSDQAPGEGGERKEVAQNRQRRWKRQAEVCRGKHRRLQKSRCCTRFGIWKVILKSE